MSKLCPTLRGIVPARQSGISAMFRLASILYSIIGTTMAGSLVVFVLVIGRDTLVPILLAAGAGALLALPVTWLVTRAMMADGTTE